MAKRKRSTQTQNVAPVAAPPQPAAKSEDAPLSRKEQLRLAAVAKRRRQTFTLYGAGAAVAVVIAILVGINIARSQPVVGEQVFASQGNLHIALGSVSPVDYNTTPPTSGPHYENLAGWGVQREQVRYEHLLHNLEDGGVVIYYQCPDDCPELVAELTAAIDPYLASGRRVVLARNDPTWTIGEGYTPHRDMDAPIALTAWRRLLTLDTVDPETIGAFIERYEGIDNHRPGG
jgi:hypothetical protein